MKPARTNWKELELGSILRYLDHRVELDDEKEYQTITVKRRHGGLEIRETLLGHQIATKKQFQLVPGAFIISRVQCWHQAYAMVGEVPANTIASTNYDQFAISPTVDPRFFWWLSHTPAFTETVRSSAVGVIIEKMVFNREQWLTRSVPLPPLPEQRRIVARIEELAPQIHEARTLRNQAAEESAVLYAQTRDKIFRELNSERRRIGDVFDLINGRAFKPEDWQDRGRRIVRIQNLKYADAPYNRFSGQVDPKHLVHHGDVLFAWSGQVVSLGAHIWDDEEAILNQHIFNVHGRIPLLPEFVKEGFNALIDEMKNQVRGLEMFHIRKQELVELRFPVPPLAEQRRIVSQLEALQLQVDALKRLQTETAAELDALLPAILDRAFKGELY